MRSWVSGGVWAGPVLQGWGTKAVSALGSAISSWKMLLLFKKRMVWLPRRTRHLAMGDASSAQLGLVSADRAAAPWADANIVLYKLATLLSTASSTSVSAPSSVPPPS